MEGPTPEPKPRKRLPSIVVLLLAAVVAAASLLAAWEVARPRSLREVLSDDQWRAGTTVAIEGTITRIDRENTTYGPRVVLGLDNSASCLGRGNVLGNPNGTYRVGESIQATLHFQAVTINGDPAVTAPELYCPFPSNLEAIGTVFDATSHSEGGLMLVYNGTSADGASRYEVVTRNGAAYRPDILPVTLRKSTPIQGTNPRLPAGGPVDSAARWAELGGLQNLGASGAYSQFPIVDEMGSLSSGASRNGTLRFDDANRDGRLDTGDRLEAKLAPTAAAGSWETYLLTIGTDSSYAAATRFIVNGPKGPLEVALTERQAPLVDLRHERDQDGGRLTSEIAVVRRFGPAPAISDLKFGGNIGGAHAEGSLTALPIALENGVVLTFTDANRNGRLDSGDRFLIGNLVNHTFGLFTLRSGDRSVGTIFWIAGYGEPIGRLPRWQLDAQGTNPWRATASVRSWSPELALNRTLRASLYENDVAVVTNVSLVNGTIGTFPNGSLTFTDVEGDGMLSSGDFFTWTGTRASYRLWVSLLFDWAGAAVTV